MSCRSLILKNTQMEFIFSTKTCSTYGVLFFYRCHLSSISSQKPWRSSQFFSLLSLLLSTWSPDLVTSTSNMSHKSSYFHPLHPVQAFSHFLSELWKLPHSLCHSPYYTLLSKKLTFFYAQKYPMTFCPSLTKLRLVSIADSAIHAVLIPNSLQLARAFTFAHTCSKHWKVPTILNFLF